VQINKKAKREKKLDSLKKKISMLGIVALIIVVTATLVACSSASPATTQITTPPATAQITALPTTSAATTSQIKTTPTTSAATTPNQASGGSVADLLGRAAGTASMKYDMVITAADNSVTTSTAWLKKNKMRMESNVQGQNTVTLIDRDAKTMYLYTPAQNSAMKMDFGQAPQSAPGSSISQYNPVIVGSETVDGKFCQIVQYTVNGIVTKEWVWDSKGLPVRMQTTTSLGIMTIDFKNYDFSDIPDSMFVLPAGVQITSFNLPSGMPTSMPSGFPTSLPTGLPTK
jgi:hypothetical protein